MSRSPERIRREEDETAAASAPNSELAKLLRMQASAGNRAVSQLLRVSKDGAEEVWKANDVLSAHYNTPVRVGRYLFGFDGRQEEGARLRCVDWKAGKVRWTEPPDDAGGSYGCGAILAAGGKLIILNESGELVLAEASGDKYAEKARASVLGSPCRAHPALADGRLYARDGKKLVCWDLRKK
jgi:outer membrane protein assembly factor BamB